MKYLLLGILFALSITFFHAECFAQNNTYAQPPKIIPSSPDVAALQRFGDIPVSPYTGVPNISVPIYTIKSGDIGLPLSINYHASGIKVRDEASRVGLGWALNAGGVITRTILNMDDFASRSEGYHFNTSVPDVIDGPKADLGRGFNIQGDNGECSVDIGSKSYGPYLTNRVDFEPDLYNFNFLGYSGTFMLKRNKDVVLLKSEKLKITYLSANGGTWEIKTPDGTTYLFEVYEDYLDYYSDYGSGQPVVNAWHLTKITSPKGRIVEFLYQKPAARLKVPGTFFETRYPTEIVSGSASGCGSTGDLYLYYLNQPNKEYSKVYLDRIRFDNGYVAFFYSPRDDIDSDVKLDSIQLVQGSNTVLKRWIMDHGYFTGTATGPNETVGTFATRTKRLKLVSLTEKGRNSEAISPYVFTYNEPLNAPTKTSFALDHWGYFNGKVGNTHLAPDMLENNSSSLAAKLIGTIGDNRTVDPAYNQMFILKEIKYPTGGRTVFEYETNDFDIKKSMVNDHSYYSNNFPAVVQKTIRKMYPGNVHQEQPLSNQVADYIIDLTDMAVDTKLAYPTASVNLTAFFRYNGSAVSPCMLTSSVYGTLCKEDGTILEQSDIAAFIGQTSAPMTTCIVNNSNGNYIGAQFTNTYHLPRGKYLWKVFISSGVNYIEDVSLRMDYPGLKDVQDISNNGITLTGADFGGGLRIKRISDYDNMNSGPVNVKRYEYSYIDAEGKSHSYGRRMAQPVYAYFDKKYYSNSCSTIPLTIDFHTWTRVIQSESLVPLESSISGTAVGYDTVVVYEGEHGENGKTVYQFENEPHIILDYSQPDYFLTTASLIPRKPAAFPIIQNFGNGNLLSRTEYKNVDGMFIPVRQTINSYAEFFPANNAVSYGIERRPINGVIPSATCQFEAFLYPLMTKSRKLLVTETTNLYDQSDPSRVFTTVKNYTYNQDSHLQLTNISETNSKGDEITTSYTYPLDYSDANSDAAIQQMKGTVFMHSIPVTQYVSIRKVGTTTPVLKNGIIYKYGVQNGLVLQKEVATADLTSPASIPSYQPSSNIYPTNFTAKLKFNTYDAQGNILEVQKNNDQSISYIWDHLKTYPVAEVKNGAASDIAYNSFEGDGNGNWSGIDPTSILSNVPGITGTKYYSQSGFSLSRTGLNANLSYTVSYWSKNGAYTITGSTVTTGSTFNGWTYYEHKVANPSGGTITITGSGAIDELRLYPSGAQMITYTYDPLLGLTAQCDAANHIMYYEYDMLGRAKLLRDQEGNVVKTFEYHYTGQ
jgi:hypothetical protein